MQFIKAIQKSAKICKIKHEYLRSRADICLSLSSFLPVTAKYPILSVMKILVFIYRILHPWLFCSEICMYFFNYHITAVGIVFKGPSFDKEIPFPTCLCEIASQRTVNLCIELSWFSVNVFITHNVLFFLYVSSTYFYITEIVTFFSTFFSSTPNRPTFSNSVIKTNPNKTLSAVT